MISMRGTPRFSSGRFSLSLAVYFGVTGAGGAFRTFPKTVPAYIVISARDLNDCKKARSRSGRSQDRSDSEGACEAAIDPSLESRADRVPLLPFLRVATDLLPAIL